MAVFSRFSESEQAVDPMNTLKGVRVAFLQGNAINESPGLYDLAGHLKALGVVTRLFLRNEELRISEKVRQFDPELIVIPCDLLGHNNALELARIGKDATGATLLLGGTHPTFFPNVVLRDNVDYAFAGEAEGVVSDLLVALRAGEDPSEIPNLIVRHQGSYRLNPLRPVIGNLDDLAMPDREIYYRYRFLAAFPWKKFNTGRGCLNSCGFCFNPTYHSILDSPDSFFRRKSPDRIIQEIDEVRKRCFVGIIHFSDDLFSSGVDFLEPFVEAYRERVPIPFSCNAFARTIDDRTVRLLREGGCKVISMGVEIADDKIRMEVMNKPVSTEQIVEAARMLKDAGIRVITYNILGLPWSSVEKDIDTLILNRRIGSDHTRVTMLVPFPKSRMTRMLIEKGSLARDFEEKIYEVPDLPRWPGETLFTRFNSEKTERLQKLWPLMLELNIPKAWIGRLVQMRLSILLVPFCFLVVLSKEKKVFGLGWLSGFRYFLHVRNPGLKTTNYVSFI